MLKFYRDQNIRWADGALVQDREDIQTRIAFTKDFFSLIVLRWNDCTEWNLIVCVFKIKNKSDSYQ